jgi:LCP family protein required for cell wall assembly
MISAGLCAATAVALLAAGTAYVNSSVAGVQKVEVEGLNGQPGAPDPVLPTKIENYLLVGSDNRDGADPTDPDYGGIGSAAKTEGQNSDTIMVLRFDPKTGGAAILSLPRDLLVDIPRGTPYKDKINSAFGFSRALLIKTIQTNFQIPIHHYVEVNFASFKSLVDAIGGVSVYFDTPVRDKNTGLEILQPGCVKLDGVKAREWVRSRHLEYMKAGKWVSDQTSDFGRISRQQDFVKRAIAKAMTKATNPLVASQLIDVAKQNLKVDPTLDLIGLAARMRQLGSGAVDTYTLPNHPDKVKLGKLTQDVLIVDDTVAKPILDYFRGVDEAAPVQPPDDPATSDAAPADSAATTAATTAAATVAPAPVLDTPPTTAAPVGILPDATRTCPA